MATADERIYDELTQTLLHPWRESKKKAQSELETAQIPSRPFLASPYINHHLGLEPRVLTGMYSVELVAIFC